MAASRWMFTKEQLQNTPSRKNGIDADKELSYRQQGANLIQDMGQRLSVTQLCINTAIVYMHRFYMFQSFSRFPRNEMAPAALFLAAKVEEQPRKLEHVIKVAHSCLHRDNTPAPDTRSEAYLEQAQQLVINENILLQTLGFEVTVDHPHTHIVKATNLVKASKDLAQTSYFLATNSLHMTTFSLQYRPTIVACVCIYLACKWSNWKIPRSNEGREWFQYVDRSVTPELLEDLYAEFISILEKYPHKLRKKIMGWKGDKEGNAKEEECLINFDQPFFRKMRPEAQQANSSHESNRPSSTQHKHTNHDRKDVHNPNKDTRSDPKLAHENRKHNTGHDRKDGHSDRKLITGDRKETSSSVPHSEKKDLHVEGPDKMKGLMRRDGHSERKDGHGDRKEPIPHPRKEQLQQEKQKHGEHRQDKKPTPRETGDNAPAKMETNSQVRSQTSSNTHTQKAKVEFEIGADNSAKIKKEPNQLPPPPAVVSNLAAQSSGELRKSKSDLSINYKEYLKRKEQEREKVEKERHERMEREKVEREKMRLKLEAENLNKTFSEGTEREKKHRPPKLDMSLPAQMSLSEHRHSDKDNKERPYEVNIKSPVKPHYNITVKSPIKSSELKQPKLEITKVHLAPDKNGSDSCSVNINTDPNLKKIIDNIKQEPSVSNSKSSSQDLVDSPRVKVKTELNDSTRTKDKPESRAKVKVEPTEEVQNTDIDLHPEHSAPPTAKIKELGYEPPSCSVESAGSLKMSIKQESGGSGRSTPVISQIKSESGSGPNTPIRHKIIMPASAENSPLKLKISTKAIPDLENSTEKYKSPHRHHKHKDKHKSHKHSKDKHREKHREKRREKEGGGSSSSGTNGHPLKMSIKLSDIQGHSSSSNESWSVKHKHDKHKHKHTVSDPALNRNNNAEAERQQPWSMTDLLSNKKAVGTSPARKRRRTPTVEVNNDLSHSHSKAAKTDTHGHRLRRSSSSHSVVSMEMSDGDDGHGHENVIDQPQVVNQLQESLQQMIDQTKRSIAMHQKQQKKGSKSSSAQNAHDSSRRPSSIDRQQSGFDLEGMMWSSVPPSDPPLPADAAPPLPRHPPSNVPPPPPPPV